MTYEDLYLKFTNFQKKWNSTLKDNAVEYAIGTKFELLEDRDKDSWKKTKPPVPIIFANVIANSITDYAFFDIEVYISDEYESIKNDLKFFPSYELKKEGILNRIKEIRDEILENAHFHDTAFLNYPESIFSQRIIQESFRFISKETKEEILEKSLRFSDPVGRFFHRELTNDIHQLLSFHDLTIELELLNIHYNELSLHTFPEKKKVEKPNPYPLVFSSSITFELFMYCISEYQNGDITPALFAKFYLLFKERDYIIGHKYKPYKKFVIDEFNVVPSRARTDRSLEPYDNHFLNFIRNFKNLMDIKTIE